MVSPAEIVTRAWAGLQRLLIPVPLMSVSVSSVAARGGYSAKVSMSAMARFPWVRAAALARVNDLARLPIVAMQGGGVGTGAGKQVDDPGLQLILHPSERYTSRQLRRQAYLDYSLTGRSYTWRRPGPVPTLCRLHPHLVTPFVDRFGLIERYEYRSGGSLISIPWREMMAVVDVSWQDDLSAAAGEGPIRSLASGLTAEMYAEELAGKSAKRGRPDVIISPASELVGFGESGPKEIADEYQRKMELGVGALVVGAGVKVDTVAYTARDMEFSQMREDNRFAVMAAIGTPSARVGMPGESYNGSKQQLRLYWEDLMSMAALFDDAWSGLAVRPGVRLQHSFVDVEALQVSRSERQQRAALWVDMGATPAQAAEYEGFADAPVPDERLDSGSLPQRRPPRQPEDPQAKQMSIEDAIGVYLRGAADRYLAGTSDAHEIGRLCAALEVAGVGESGPWAAEVVAVTSEVVRQILEADKAEGIERATIAGMHAFSAGRARALAAAIREAA